jgi:hypothetical protein
LIAGSNVNGVEERREQTWKGKIKVEVKKDKLSVVLVDLRLR